MIILYVQNFKEQIKKRFSFSSTVGLRLFNETLESITTQKEFNNINDADIMYLSLENNRRNVRKNIEMTDATTEAVFALAKLAGFPEVGILR